MALRDDRNVGRFGRSQDIKYMKVLLNCLTFIGAWSENENTETNYTKLYRFYLFYVICFCYVTELMYLKNNIGYLSFFELGHSYITVFLSTVAFTRLILCFWKKYHGVVRYFVTVIHLWNHKVKSEHAMKTHKFVEKISHFFTYYLLTVTLIGISLFNLIPMYINYASGAFSWHPPENVTFQQAVYYSLPFDYTTNIKGYIVILIFNWYVSHICCAFFCSIDLLLCLMVFHLWGHLNILIHNLRNFPRPQLPEIPGVHSQVNLFSEDERKDVVSQIQENIEYHNLIVGFSSTMSDTFGWVLVIYYVFHQVSGCFLLLQCSKMDMKTLMNYGPLTVVMFYLLIQISVVFELLGSIGDKLPDAVYSLPWEYMNHKDRKLVLLFLLQSQRPLNLRAMNMVNVGVQTMATILKTSISYFIMLRALAAVET